MRANDDEEFDIGLKKIFCHRDVYISEAEGYEFTFDNGEAGVDNRQCRLDRAFSNEGWRELFPYAKVINMNREWSDHSPVKVVLDGRERLDGPRVRNFHFEQIWVGEEGCEDTIKKMWEEEDWNVVETIARCSRELQKWKGVSIGKIMRDLSRKRRRLEWLNNNERTVENVRERKAVIKDINFLLQQEEVFWRRRSRALWLKEGDRNTKYFHRKAGQRKKKNRIGRIIVEGERVVTGEDGIKGAAVDFFSSLFTSSQPDAFDGLLEGLKDRVTLAMNESLRAEYKGEEVFEALQQMHPLKAPGPDAFVPGRRLRQGDPLSPYLFILCAEVLSSMIRRKVEEGVLHGIRVAPSSPVVSHLLFADDSLIFVKANETRAGVVMDLLGQYESASGQLVSKEKTTVSFSKGTAAWRRDKVASVLGVQVVQEQGKYLGLPTVIGHSKQVLNKVVRDKLYSKMQGWRGNNSSYTWRSICDAKHVMRLGVRRRVGDGKGTRVWLDPWIPGTSSRCVISPRGGFDLEMKVDELMVAGEARWDREKVGAMFLPFETERIMSIRLSELAQEDSWCWDGARDGEYSVREGYRLLAADESDEGEQSDTSMGSWLWKAIWSTPVLPRIKVFMCQLCSDALPVKSNIATRVRDFDCSCPKCHDGEESCIHMVRDCGWNEEVWEMVGLEVFRSHRNLRIREWVEVELRAMGVEERILFMTSCWVIWEQRNKLLFDNGMWTGERVVRRVTDVVWEMKFLTEDRSEEQRRQGISLEGGRWSRPSGGVWKISVDAGVKEGMGVGLGAVCRNGDGRVAWAVSVQAEGVCPVQMAEAEAVLLGLKEARCVGMRNVIVESDCLNVVADLQGGKKGRSDIFLIYKEILSLVPSFDSVIFNYTRRDCNKLAHLVAHASPWIIGRRFWLDVLPLSFANVAEQDLINI
ncbi:uncharacterized protein LOC141628601 [Silene latifolia]|uniref:uncharacterized protein LOC141628601 n=1 Tax=Silene latifolia TaxID=37657 RepID=UPI003D784F8C